MPRSGERVRTEAGEELRIGERLGGGLQGSVFAIEGDPDRCVKVFGALPAAGVLALRHRIKLLAQRGPAGALVLPQVALDFPHVGYVMERVHGHQPIGVLCDAPAVARGEQSLRSWYVQTGGLRKRLLLGERIARSFQLLHTRGLHYGDISFGNLLVSTSGAPSMRLIDCDNLSLDGACSLGVQGTPWFIAPEILDGGRSPSAATDAWSLAVILYSMLCLRHPLLGDAVRSAAPEAEERALRGRFYYAIPSGELRPSGAPTEPGDPLPWVDDPADDRNRSGAGIGPKHTVSATLMALFHRAFSSGLRDPSRRPTEGEWAEALGRSGDAALLCQDCKSTSYLSKHQRCPWCDAVLVVPGLLHIWHPDGKRPLTVERARLLYPRHLSGRTGSPDDQPIGVIELHPDGLRLTAKGAELRVRPPGADSPAYQRVGPGRSQVLQKGAKFSLHERGPEAEVVVTP
jgi:DNA-binding helix-hairpin-helix protein with protein kinase domain